MQEIDSEFRHFSQWRFGDCYPMAYALSDLTGWKPGSLVVDVPNDYYQTNRPHIVHAYVISPDGHFYDALGPITEDYMRKEFLEKSSRQYTNPVVSQFEIFP
jgi:hypothetical protein